MLTPPDVLYALNIVYNVHSIHCLALNNLKVQFKRTQIFVFGKHASLVGFIIKTLYVNRQSDCAEILLAVNDNDKSVKWNN